MSLPEPKLSRALRHVRNIEAQAFEREDGLWDIDTRITDTKTRVSHLASGDRHITELAGILPTAAIQAFAGDVLPTGDTGSGTDMTQVPFQLDRCHALRRDGPAVEKYYPRWYIKPALGS